MYNNEQNELLEVEPLQCLISSSVTSTIGDLKEENNRNSTKLQQSNNDVRLNHNHIEINFVHQSISNTRQTNTLPFQICNIRTITILSTVSF